MTADDAGPSPPEQDHWFPVVGIGASAGGLEALGHLLESLPPATGMAFVVVQHLDPRQPSALVSLLGARTGLRVLEATPDVVVQPEHVYVIPPNATMTMVGGCLRLTARAPGPTRHLPIDDLFCSIAADRPGGAIGVILSGTGSDGTRGVEAIKAAGGLTYAQDDVTAKFPAMPRSAVESGCIDRVLPPDGIARELVHVVSHPLLFATADDDTAVGVAEDLELSRVISLLQATHGVDFGSYRKSTLRRRITRRLVLQRIGGFAEYAHRLAEDRVELDALYHDVLINVTSFFRDPAVFEALRDTVFPALMQHKDPGSPIRMWVPGCSTGQEAYSLVIALIEFLEERDDHRHPIQVFATDLSDAVALRKAREGVYANTIESEVSPERLRRFFTRTDAGYRVAKSLREIAVFARHDIAGDPPFSHMDLVSCRNLLIYLEPATQRRVLSTVHYALEPWGALVLGAAETIGSAQDLFAPLDLSHRIYTRRAATTRYPHFRGGRHGESPAGGRVVGDAPDWRREADRVVLSEWAPAGILVDGDLEILQFRGDTAPYLTPPVGEPSNHLLRLARDGLFAEVRDAVRECRDSVRPVRRQHVRLRSGQGIREIDLRVLPVRASGAREQRFLVLFEERSGGGFAVARRDGGLRGALRWVPGWLRALFAPGTESAHAASSRLQADLESTREYLHAVIERQHVINDSLTTANEEIQSSNEELQSTNEELETAKEELQSVNEELTTVNEQLHERNAEIARVSDDLQNMLGSSEVPMVALDAERRIRRVTPVARHPLHVLHSDIGRPIAELRPLVDMPDLDAVCAQVIASGVGVEREVRDDDGRWFALRVHPYHTSQGAVDGAVVVLSDIDAAKKVQTLLQAARDYAESIVETVRHPLVVLDRELRIESANDAFCEMYTLDPARIRGRPIGQLVGGSHGVELTEQLREVADAGIVLEHLEVRRTFDAVGERTMLVNARRLLGMPVGIPWLLLAIEDVTERQLLERGLRERAELLALADRQKSEFLAILGHELRNPLTPLRNALHIQRLAGHDPVATKRAREMMERQVMVIARLIDDLLDLSRLRIGRIELRRERLDLFRAVEQVVDIERPLFEGSQRHVTLVRPTERVYVAADPVRLDQIVTNLLTNAVKYTDPGGRIDLRVARDGGTALLEVTDDGIGFSAELLPRIWDLFTQADWTSRRGSGGLGIGLSLVRSLVELHGGTVEAYSEGTDSGARFTVHLPLAAEGAASDRSSPSPATTSALPAKKRSVLVVDDDRDVAASLGLLLELMGHTVRVAHDGHSALEIARTLHPEVMLIDIGMGGMSGLEVAQRLRAEPMHDGSLLVALTGFGAPDDHRRSLEAGFDLHLTKPTEPDELVRILASARSTVPAEG